MVELSSHHAHLLNATSPSVSFVDDGDYQFLTLKFLSIDDEELVESSTTTLFGSDGVEEIDHQQLQKQGLASEVEALTQIKRRTEYEIELLTRYSEEVDLLEDQLYERALPRAFLAVWFKIKRDLLKLERVLSRRLNVVREFQAAKKLNSKEARHLLGEIVNRLDSHSRNATHQLQRLDSIQRFYESIKQDRLNNNVYLLAIVSTIFLPLNLIVGFFGINTENLYFANHPKGTQYVLVLLVGTFVALLIALPVIRFIDQLILRRLFSSSALYTRLSKRIERLGI